MIWVRTIDKVKRNLGQVRVVLGYDEFQSGQNKLKVGQNDLMSECVSVRTK